MNEAAFTFTTGTHRLCPPEVTLERILPHLPDFGITRSADITRLDEIDIPVWSAIRPRGKLLQVSNGKGLSPQASRVSAIMEAIELHHAENPEPCALRRTSKEVLESEGETALEPAMFDGFLNRYFGPAFKIDWASGQDLLTGRRVWAPASAIYFFVNPCLHHSSTNGLASGNHVDEATLHALYELIERDAVSRLSVDGKLQIRKRCAIVNPSSIPEGVLADLVAKVHAARTEVRLISVPSPVGIPVFWAAILNQTPFASASTLNVGWGAHFDPLVAASRAVTEAVQSRVIFISGAREDLLTKPSFTAPSATSSPAFRFFQKLESTATWAEATAESPEPPTTLDAALKEVLRRLEKAGHGKIWRFVLSSPRLPVAVVKTIVPSLIHNRRLF